MGNRGRALRLRVSDDGAGGAQSEYGTGLTGLRDRVEALGGSTTVTSPVGHGTELEVLLPVSRPADEGPQAATRDG